MPLRIQDDEQRGGQNSHPDPAYPGKDSGQETSELEGPLGHLNLPGVGVFSWDVSSSISSPSSCSGTLDPGAAAAAGCRGDNLKHTRNEMSELNRLIQGVRCDIANVKKQVRRMRGSVPAL